MKPPFIFLIFLLILTIPKPISAQAETSFKPAGKPEARIFFNFNTALSDGKTVNRFEVTRAYLGYIYNFSETFSGRLTYDVGNSSSGKFQMTALLKYGYLLYRKKNLCVTGGVIPTTIFELSEKKWGYRYLYKSFIDEYGMGYSADLGISAAYFIDKRLSADIIVTNGEGYKQMDGDSALKAGVGITFYPSKNLTFRAYAESMKKEAADQIGYALFASYGNERFNLNAEYNWQKDHNLKKGQNYGGLSLYGTIQLKKSIKVFARFDLLESNKLTVNNQPWNISKDGQLYIAGFEFSPVRGVKISPNYQGWEPSKSGNPFISKFYLNLEIRM